MAGGVGQFFGSNPDHFRVSRERTKSTSGSQEIVNYLKLIINNYKNFSIANPSVRAART